MTNSNNRGMISRMHTNPYNLGLVDATDFPHSGIFKALNVGTQGNYAIIDGTLNAGSNNFDITQSGDTIFTVAAGKVMRDGKIISVVPVGSSNIFTQGGTFDEPASGNAYFLLVVDSSNVLAIRGTNVSVDTIPELSAGDIPIAVIKLENGGTATNRQIQFLTTAKAENSLSIGYDDTGYTETATIQGLIAGTTITNSVGDFVIDNTDTNDQIIARLGTDTSATGFEVRNNSDAVKFSVSGAGVTDVKSLSLGTAGELTITESSDDITIKNTVTDKDIIFNVKPSGVDTEIIRISPTDSALTVGGVISSTGNKVKFADMLYDAVSSDYALSLTEDNTVWLDMMPLALTSNTVTLPSASSAAIGHQFRLIVKQILPTFAIKLSDNGTDEILDETGLQLNASGDHPLVAGKIYDIICVSGTRWLLQTLN